MRMALRVLVGVAGLLFVFLGLQFWLNPAALAGKLGVSPVGELGLATIRADMAAFFGVGGGFALAAAFRGERKLLTTPLVLVAVALVGRVVTVAVSGLSPEMVQPMVVEAVLVGLFGLARQRL